MTERQDDELIKRAQEGDRRAFEALLQGYYDAMFRMAFKWCGNRADAEDVTQNACIKLAHSLKSFRFEAAFTSWLYRLVINTAMDWRKANRKFVPLPESGHAGIAPGNAEKDMQHKEALAAVLALPEKEKAALLLVFSEGMTHAEAAGVMGVKESTVSWYIHEARKKLTGKERRHG
ncbi:MAG: RNA polymerase sigma factor [Proteobacteria bacterium]|nr:RNA polymerase sigma factor [Pseudomonadota bacterium]